MNTNLNLKLNKKIFLILIFVFFGGLLFADTNDYFVDTDGTIVNRDGSEKDTAKQYAEDFSSYAEGIGDKTTILLLAKPIDKAFKGLMHYIMTLFPSTGYSVDRISYNENSLMRVLTMDTIKDPLDYENYEFLNDENGRLNNSSTDITYVFEDTKDREQNANGVFKILFVLAYVFVCFYCAYKTIKGMINSREGIQASMFVALLYRMIIAVVAFLILPYMPVVLINFAKFFAKMLTGVEFKESNALLVTMNLPVLSIILVMLMSVAATSFLEFGASFFVNFEMDLTSLATLSLPVFCAIFAACIAGFTAMINIYVWELELFLALIAIVFMLPFTLFDLSSNASPIGIKLSNILKFFFFNFIEICIGFVVINVLYVFVQGNVLSKSLGNGLLAKTFCFVVPSILIIIIMPVISKVVNSLLQGTMSDTNSATTEAIRGGLRTSTLYQLTTNQDARGEIGSTLGRTFKGLKGGISNVNKANENALKTDKVDSWGAFKRGFSNAFQEKSYRSQGYKTKGEYEMNQQLGEIREILNGMRNLKDEVNDN